MGDHQKKAICVCSDAWRTIWIEVTIENASKRQERQVHRIRRGEQSLLADGSRKKTSGASKERDIQ